MTPLKLVSSLHNQLIFKRRIECLSNAIAALIPASAKVLDVGCGDGQLAALIINKREDISVEGVEIMLRQQSHIPITLYDGQRLPKEDESVDVVMFVDILHHTTDPTVLLKEAVRVSKGHILIKDHLCESSFSYNRLKMMDWVGNAPHGVKLTYNYWPKEKWLSSFGELKLGTTAWKEELGLYPPPLQQVFGKGLHFVALLEKPNI